MTQLPLPWAGTDAIDPSITVRAFAERWLATSCAPPFVTAYTSKTRRYILSGYVLPYVGDLPIRDVTQKHLREMQLALFGRKLAFSTVRNAFYAGLGPLLREAWRDGLIEGQPMRGLRWPRFDPPKPDPYTPTEMRAVLAWFQRREPQWLPFVAMVCLAGMRPSEAAALTWGELDIATGKIPIERAMIDGRLSNTKTERSRRTIFVSRRLRTLLARCAGKPEDLIVTRRDGRPMVTHVFGGSVMKRCTTDLGIRHRGLYRGRSGFISKAAADGANLAHIAAFVGSSVGRIERSYLRWVKGLTDPVEAIGRRHRRRA